MFLGLVLGSRGISVVAACGFVEANRVGFMSHCLGIVRFAVEGHGMYILNPRFGVTAQDVTLLPPRFAAA